MSIQDLAYNLLDSGATGQMIGYTPGQEVVGRPSRLGLKIYSFIIDGIRKEDKHTSFFLQRYLEGPQVVWNTIEDRITELKTLWDVENIDD